MNSVWYNYIIKMGNLIKYNIKQKDALRHPYKLGRLIKPGT